ncbi:hypothetical protein EZV73_00045 [Acidaminobacter sp. JC074]|uniref:hypothetical protein n=1 Tax=Acidaminobacter sp. JC074 TaxID=2530199 RepID=UPI001F0ED26B|nr:hypothetical protein [Acidaminobacter sp. JC074]MCH4885928.1 hypothetical protein [Acidaminobacter sp. JC074]
MKKIMIGIIVILIIGLAYMGFNMERIFATSSPTFIGEFVSNETVLDKIDQIDIETSTRQDIISLYGEPESYIWEDETYVESNLSGHYIMVYSDDFNIWMIDDQIIELRFYDDFYECESGIKVGMTKDEVLELLGNPNEIRTGTSNGYIDGVYYDQIDGKNYDYYQRSDLNIRMFLDKDVVFALYVMRDNMNDFVQGANEALAENASSLIRVNTDDIDLPFENDDEVIGTWKSVDFVDDFDQFQPEKKFWGGDLYLKELVFLEGGEFDKDFRTWTKGFVMHHGDLTASAYTIKEINGATYMFYEWKSGDYVYRDQKPSYYVLKKE